MKICGIVAEYDPFHNGHALQIARALEAGATHIVCVMSGAFVQRGTPSFFSKFDRARMAVSTGADLVLELPVPYASASSERFAFGGVSLLEALDCVEMLSFGCECGDLMLLKTAAAACSDSRVLSRISALVRAGEPYPLARIKALEVFCPEAIPAVKGANNLLAVDYLKAIDRLGSKIQPHAVLREGAGHDSELPEGRFASASCIRGILRGGSVPSWLLPPASREIAACAMREGSLSLGWAPLETAVLCTLTRMTREEFRELPDCADGLGDRLWAAAGTAKSLEELLQNTKTKAYTMSRVRRAMLHAFLGILPVHTAGPVPYARILAIGPGGAEILKAMRPKKHFPVTESLLELSRQSGCRETADLEALASDLRGLSTARRTPRSSDYTAKLFVTRGKPLSEEI